MESMIIKRLAHFAASPNPSIIREDLVKNALYRMKKHTTPEELKEFIEAEFGCSISQQEITIIIKGLLRKNSILTSGTNQYFLGVETIKEIETKLLEFQDLESNVITRWEDEIKSDYQLDEKFIKELSEQLKLFCYNLFYLHGVESKKIISSEVSDVTNNDIGSLINDCNFTTEEIKEIAKIEYVKFLGSSDMHNLNYLDYLYNRAISFLSQVCDPEVLKVLKNNLSGTDIYIDTNILFRLIGLQGEKRQKSIEETIKLCSQFGIKIKVTTRTISEFDHTIERFYKYILANPAPRSMFEVAYQYRNTDNFISIFWKEAHETGIEPKDFYERYRSIDLILKERNIDIVDTTRLESELKDVTDEIISKYNMFIDENGIDRHLSVVEHDCFHISFIKQLQGNNVRRFTDAKAFFLTADHSLLRFQNQEYNLRNTIPLILLPSNIITIFSFITPKESRNVDFFLSFFSNNFYSTRISNETIQKIISKISHVRNSPTIAEKILANDSIINRYMEFTEESEQQLFLEMAIDHEIEKMKFDLIEANTKAEEVEQKLEEERSKNIILEHELRKAREEQSSAIESFRQERNLNQNIISEKEMLLKKLEEHIKELEEQKKKNEKYSKYFRIGLFSIATVVFFALLLLDNMYLYRHFEKIWRFIFYCVVCSLYILAYYCTFKSKGLGVFATIVVTVVIGYLSLFWN